MLSNKEINLTIKKCFLNVLSDIKKPKEGKNLRIDKYVFFNFISSVSEYCSNIKTIRIYYSYKDGFEIFDISKISNLSYRRSTMLFDYGVYRVSKRYSDKNEMYRDFLFIKSLTPKKENKSVTMQKKNKTLKYRYL